MNYSVFRTTQSQASAILDALLVVIVAAAITAVFLPAIENGFVWDDWGHLFRPEYLEPMFWFRAVSEPLPFSSQYYRPLPVVSFIAEILLNDGYDPRSMHRTNVLLHSFNTSLVMILAYWIGRRQRSSTTMLVRLIAVAAGLIYGWHPALVEPVAWISGRFDLLLTSFLLLSLLANCVVVGKIARPLFVGGAFLAGALCKESAAVFPLILIAWNLAHHPRPLWPVSSLYSASKERGEVAVYGAVVAAGVLYLLLRHGSLGLIIQPIPPSGDESAHSGLQSLLYGVESLVRYLLLMLNPYTGAGVVHPHSVPVPLDDKFAWTSLAGLSAIITALFLLVKRGSAAGWLWIALIISLLPASHMFIPVLSGDNIISDRNVAFPLALYALTIALLLHQMRNAHFLRDPTRHRATLGIILFVTCLLAMSVIGVRTTIPLWRNDTTLWTWATIQAPESALAHANLGGTLLDNQRYDLAYEHGVTAIRLAPDLYAGYYVTGRALLELGDADFAVDYLLDATIRTPLTSEANAMVHVSLADAFMRLGHYDRAEPILLKTAEIAPFNRRINELLYIHHIRSGRSSRSNQQLEGLLLLYSPAERPAIRERLDRALNGFLYPKSRISISRQTSAR